MSRVHLVGVCGTGMGALASLFRQRGDRVSGSDTAFDPPVGPALREQGIECSSGYDAAHLEPAPDLVIVGNVIRRDNPEAIASEKLKRTSMSGALREHFLSGKRPVVVCGTHGKTTTTALAAHLLYFAHFDPGWFIGGIPKNLPAAANAGKRNLARDATPFVIEGDEYDDVYWSKKPKFLDYVGIGSNDVVILTSVEQDHVDIYPTMEAYEDAFRALVKKIPSEGLLVVSANSPRAIAIARDARCNVVRYGSMEEECEWQFAPGHIDDQGRQHFDAYAGGSALGRFQMDLVGEHNIRNALAVLCVAATAFQIPWATSRAALAQFEGVKRRQDLRGTPRGIRVYDDFAHHPTAVHETLRALKTKHPKGKLFSVFEPRSATACRDLHQEEYARAFESADRVLFAPLGRTNIEHPLDLQKLCAAIGTNAETLPSVDAIVSKLASEAKEGDTIAILSNGAFGGIHDKLLEALR